MLAQFNNSRTLPWLLFSFQGRISRRMWWLWGVAAMLGLGIYLTVIFRVAGLRAEGAEIAVNLLLLWPTLALSAKRWQDRNKSAWWVLLMLLPVIGWLWTFIENGLLKGTPGANQFGVEPVDRLDQ